MTVTPRGQAPSLGPRRGSDYLTTLRRFEFTVKVAGRHKAQLHLWSVTQALTLTLSRHFGYTICGSWKLKGRSAYVRGVLSVEYIRSGLCSFTAAKR